MEITINLDFDSIESLTIAKELLERELKEREKTGIEDFILIELDKFEDNNIPKKGMRKDKLLEAVEGADKKLFDKAINILKRQGDIFEPKEGYISKI